VPDGVSVSRQKTHHAAKQQHRPLDRVAYTIDGESDMFRQARRTTTTFLTLGRPCDEIEHEAWTDPALPWRDRMGVKLCGTCYITRSTFLNMFSGVRPALSVVPLDSELPPSLLWSSDFRGIFHKALL
jgi:hypothetical protein